MAAIGINAGKITAFLDLDISGFTNGFKAAGQELGKFKNETMSTGDKFKSVGNIMTGVGSSLTKTVTTPIVAVGKHAVESAVNWETAWTGVTKTVDGTEKQMAGLEKELKNMSLRTASSKADIAGVAEAAGQLGIATENIADFSETMIQLGDTTNLSSDEAATAIAQFANITGMAQSDAHRFGSSVVDLGNNFATTEADIVSMAMRLAGAGTQIGISETDILGFSTALSSVGIQAEMGGSAFSKFMIEMANTVEYANSDVTSLANSLGLAEDQTEELGSEIETERERLEKFAAMAGMTGDEFTQAFQEDAARAITYVIRGLSEMGGLGSESFKILNQSVEEGGQSLELFASMAGMTAEDFKEYFEQDAAGAIETLTETYRNSGDVFDLTFERISQAVQNGGEELETIAAMAGMTGEEFKAAFEDDAESALEHFQDGIYSMGDSTASALVWLDQMGYSEIRLRDTILRSTGAIDTMEEALNTSAKAWREDKALTEEANKRYGTSESRFKQFSEAVDLLAIEFGNQLLPTITDLVVSFTEFVTGLSNMDDGTKKLIVQVLLFLAAIGPVVSVLGNVIKFVGLVVGSFKSFIGIISNIIGFVSKLLGVFWKIPEIFRTVMVGAKALWAILSANPLGVIIAVVAALAAGFIYLWNTSEQFRNSITEAFANIKDVVSGLGEKFSEIFEGSIPEIIGKFLLFLLELPFRLIQIGAELINGLIKGIFGVDILGSLKGLWKSIVDGVKGFFGIHSPSTVFAEIGTNMGNGLLEGFGTLPDKVGQIFVGIKNNIIDWGESIMSKGKEVGNSFLSVVDNRFGLSKEKISGFCSGAANLLTGWGDKTRKTGLDTGNKFANDTKNMSDHSSKNVKSFVDASKTNMTQWQNQTTKVGNATDRLFTNTVKKMSTATDKEIMQMKQTTLKTIAGWKNQTGTDAEKTKQKFLTEVTGLTRKSGESIDSFQKRAIADINNWGTQTVKTSQTSGNNFEKNVSDHFRGAGNEIGNNLDNATKRVKIWGDEISQEADDAGQEFREEFNGEVKEIPHEFSIKMNQIPDYLIKLANVMPGHGRAIASGLYNAMSATLKSIINLVGNIGNTISNVVNSAVRMFNNLITSANNAKNATKKINGSHANGLSYVPFDGYIAELHEGERVLTKQENERYNKGSNNSGDTFNFYNVKDTPYEYARQVKKAKRELLEGV